MTSQLIDPSRELAREAARHDDGRFGTKALGEVDLELTVHDPAQDAYDDYYDEPEDITHDGFSLDRTISWWRGLVPAPRTAAHDDLRASVAEEVQEQTLVEIEGAPEQDPERRKWHQRFLDTALKYTAPVGYFSWKQSLKTSFTKGGVLMAGIATFAITSHFAGMYMRVEPSKPLPPQPDPAAARLTELSERYDCYTGGLGEGEIPARAIITVTRGDKVTVKAVSFDEGWAAHTDKTDNRTLRAVCRL